MIVPVAEGQWANLDEIDYLDTGYTQDGPDGDRVPVTHIQFRAGHFLRVRGVTAEQIVADIEAKVNAAGRG